jgi:hypothetical protein
MLAMGGGGRISHKGSRADVVSLERPKTISETPLADLRRLLLATFTTIRQTCEQRKSFPLQIVFK